MESLPKIKPEFPERSFLHALTETLQKNDQLYFSSVATKLFISHALHMRADYC